MILCFWCSMRYLIDTNIYVYMMTEYDKLSRDVDALLQDYDNVLCMSVESLKELIVAYRNKGLWSKTWHSEAEMVRSIMDSSIVLLPIKPEHMQTYAEMQINEVQGHKDPSDHVIIAQAITEGIPLISSDKRFDFYRRQGLDLVFNAK